MDLFIQFVGAKWYLFTAAIVLLLLLMNHERRKGGPSVSPAQLTQLVNQHEGIVVDLRDAADYRQGHIVDSLNLPLAKLPERIAELERYRDKPVVLVCKFGQSASGAAKTSGKQPTSTTAAMLSAPVLDSVFGDSVINR